MRDREPTVRSRELGDGLREAMERAKLTGRQAAAALGWSQSRVSRLLSGKRGGSELDVSAFLGVCHVSGKERDRLLSLCAEADESSYLQRYGSRLPKQLRTLIDHEDRATAISQFSPIMLPGLLQTGDYARALIEETGNVPADEIKERVSVRLGRQSLLSQSRPPRLDYYLHEFALRLPVGGPRVMSEQLHHLLRLSVRSYVSIRVVPASLGGHPGIAGQFMLLESPAYNPVAYLDSETSCLFLEHADEISAYRRILNALAEVALTGGQSRDLIADLATELYPTQEDHAR